MHNPAPKLYNEIIPLLQLLEIVATAFTCGATGVPGDRKYPSPVPERFAMVLFTSCRALPR